MGTEPAYEEPERWRASLATAFSDLVPGRLDHEPLPAGQLRGGRLGATGVFTVSGSPQTVRRSTTAVRHSPADMVKVCVPLRGRAVVHQGEREIVLLPGQLGLYDIGRPYELRLEGSWSCAVMAVPRDHLALGPGRLLNAVHHRDGGRTRRHHVRPGRALLRRPARRGGRLPAGGHPHRGRRCRAGRPGPGRDGRSGARPGDGVHPRPFG